MNPGQLLRNLRQGAGAGSLEEMPASDRRTLEKGTAIPPRERDGGGGGGGRECMFSDPT